MNLMHYSKLFWPLCHELWLLIFKKHKININQTFNFISTFKIYTWFEFECGAWMHGLTDSNFENWGLKRVCWFEVSIVSLDNKRVLTLSFPKSKTIWHFTKIYRWLFDSKKKTWQNNKRKNFCFSLRFSCDSQIK